MVLNILKEEKIDVTGYWYNPNVHPFTEYTSRLNALKQYSEMIQLPLVINDTYGLRQFVKHVISDLENRCDFCYEDRIRLTAKQAKLNGFDAFSTTLLISPYQKHERIKEIAVRIAKEEGIPFYYYDFRPYFRAGQQIAKTLPLYMQKYCGCIFSEEERYQKKLNK